MAVIKFPVISKQHQGFEFYYYFAQRRVKAIIKILIKDIPYYNETYDLHNCEHEPLRRIRRVQSYGSFLYCDVAGTTWYHASADIVEEIRKSSIQSWLVKYLGGLPSEICTNGQFIHIVKKSLPSDVLLNNVDHGWHIELEPISRADITNESYYNVVLKLAAHKSLNPFLDEVVSQIHRLTGYDHIMIYKFDEDGSGQVVNELKVESRPSYFGLKFPASDIPQQARDLYRLEKIRVVYDTANPQIVIEVNEQEKPIKELDLTKRAIRGVSPIHLEYLQNMGVGSSFSVAIIEEDKLWGLIVCHHHKARFVDFDTRNWLKFVGDYISINLSRLLVHKSNVDELKSKLLSSKIMEEVIDSKDLIKALLNGENNLQSLIACDGVFVKSKDIISGSGNIPDKDTCLKLTSWISLHGKFDCMSWKDTKKILPRKLYSDKVAGILVVQLSSITNDYIVWLRKAKVMDVVWAGNQSGNKIFDKEKGRIAPRLSFDKWVEQIGDKSEPWLEAEIVLAEQFRNSLIKQLYEKYNEIALLNKELEEAYAEMKSFSYSVSHDLKTPLRSIEGFSQILKSKYEDVLDKYGLHLLDVIVGSTSKMTMYIDDILKYNRLSIGPMNVSSIDLNEIVHNQWNLCTFDLPDAKLTVKSILPEVYGEVSMIRTLIANLLGNSVKYALSDKPVHVIIDFVQLKDFIEISVSDNGIGIASHLRHKVFDVFVRLVSEEDYPGTGVGLSIVKKVVSRYGGEINITDGERGGVCFKFTLPSNKDLEIFMNRK